MKSKYLLYTDLHGTPRRIKILNPCFRLVDWSTLQIPPSRVILVEDERGTMLQLPLDVFKYFKVEVRAIIE